MRYRLSLLLYGSFLLWALFGGGCKKEKGITSVHQDAALDATMPDATVPDATVTDASIDTDLGVPDAAPADAVVADGTPDDGSVMDGAAGDGGVITCPAEMVPVENLFCIDRYEASRPDSTSTSKGADTSYAVSQPGVMPWYTAPWEEPTHITLVEARAACAAAGKRLCDIAEWEMACGGSNALAYSYGDTYDATTCNGIDAFCNCQAGSACENITPCPYPHCYHLPPSGQSDPPNGCGAPWHIVPTGTFTGCFADNGAFDMNGNVWEIVDTTDGQIHVKGGAANCLNSELLHRCDGAFVVSGAFPSIRGFRCCLTP